MRRSDREITSLVDILDILRRAQVLHLGLQGGAYPYVVPLSYGFEQRGEKILLYFHCALEGEKLALLAQNPRVCAEVSIFHRYAETPGGVTALYESVIGFGRAERVEGEEAARGLELLLAHCGFEGYDCPAKALAATAVFRVTLDQWTGKRNLAK